MRLLVLPIAAGALLLSCSAGDVSGDVSRSARLAADAGRTDRAVAKTADAISTIHAKASRVTKTRPASTGTAPPDPHSGRSPSVEFSASEATPLECALDGVAFAECSDSPARELSTFGVEGPNADPTISIDDATVLEGNGGTVNASFSVTLSEASTGTVTVDFATAEGSATADVDFQSASGTLTFDPGITSQPVVVAVNGDTLDEVNEAFTVTLSNPSVGSSLLDAEGTGTITDDDAEPSVSINDITVTEGNAATTTATFTVTLSAASGQDVSVDFATADGSAEAAVDYIPATGSVGFAPGETTRDIAVEVYGDLTDETDETFSVVLSNPTATTIADGTAVGTITDDDATPTISVDDQTVAEGASAVFNVTLSSPSASTVTVTASTTDGSAGSPADFASVSTLVSFSPGDTSETVTVVTAGDVLDEADENYTVELSAPSSSATIADGSGLGTITDDDAEPSLSISDVTVAESGSATLTVTLAPVSGRQVSVNFATVSQSATAGSDFTTTSGTLNFAAGDTSETIVVPIGVDALDEVNETFAVDLSVATNAAIGDGQGVVTITDDDPEPSLSINDVTVAEGDSGTTNAAFTVTLSAASGKQVTVDFGTEDGTAGGSDYSTAADTLTFVPGDVSETITIPVTGDVLDEEDEDFSVNLSLPSNATIGDGHGVATITDDDPASTLSVGDQTVLEGGGNATFTVTLAPASGRQVTVDFATANDSATAGSDYTDSTGTLTFAAGETSKTIQVPITSDTLDEPNESFFVNLSNAPKATIGDGQGVGTITDDDAPPSLSIDDESSAEGADATFNVTLSAPSTFTVTVAYATSTGSASSADFTGTSGTLTFTPGETAKTVTVSTTQDALDEDPEAYTVGLSAPSNATLADNSGTGTITDDDPTPTLSIDDRAVVEGSVATFTVTLSAASGLPVNVNFASATGSAGSADFGAVSGTLSFSPGETSKEINVVTTGDALDENNEDYSITLSLPTNATIADGSGAGTITDDDPPPSISIGDQSVEEGLGASFSVTLSGASALPVSVAYASLTGSATASDFGHPVSGTLDFAPGETSKQIPVSTTEDSLDEDAENYTVELAGPSNATLGDAIGLGTITDDDLEPPVSVSDVTVTEGNAGTATATFTVSLGAVSGRLVSVNYATADQSASAGSDYVAAGSTLNFAAGETTKSVDITVNADLLDEGASESFLVNLSGATNATILDGEGAGTITDDDAPPSLSIDDPTVAEGGVATFTVTLSAPSGLPIAVGFASAPDSATAADFGGVTGTLNFAAGETTKEINVVTTGDLLDESAETFFVNLSAPSNATIGDGQGVATITDDDPTPSLSINDQTGEEGANATFTVTLSAPSGQPVSVQYATAVGSATTNDFAAASGLLEFAPGDTTKTVTVTTHEDALDEPDETYGVVLSSPTAATIADGSGAGTITDDDLPPAISVDDVTVNEGVDAIFTVSLTAASGRTVTVDYATANGSAISNPPSGGEERDYMAASGTVTFLAGETSKTVTVDVDDGTHDEFDENFFLNLTNPSEASISDAQGVATIVDNDPPTTIEIDDVTLNEADGEMSFSLTKGAQAGRSASVDYTLVPGSATAPADYAAASGTITISGPDCCAHILVQIANDALDEANENFTVVLSNPDGFTILDGTGVGTIADDDPTPSLSINDVTVTEGDAGTTNAIFTVELSAASGREVRVDFATADETADSTSDYDNTSGTLVFAAGDTTEQITVPVNADLLDETAETYFVNLSNPVAALLPDTQATGTILDNDPQPSLSVGDVTVVENDAGTVDATFTASLSAASGQTVIVGYGTSNDTATAPADYATTTGNLIFNPGQTTRTFSVPVASDLLDEANETFKVELSGASNAAIADGEGIGTITDNDPLPALAIDNVTVAEAAGSATFTVTLAPVSGRQVTVNYATTNGSATAADYTAASGTLTFAAGETTKTIAVPIAADLLDEDDETFTVGLSGAVDATIADNEGSGTIADDDAHPALSTGDATVSESAGSASFTVTLAPGSGRQVTVEYATASGTANNADYVAEGGTLNFAAGDTTKTVTVDVNHDLLDETDETFSVNLTNASNATIADGSGSATITDDDAPPALSIDNVTLLEGNSGTTNAVFTASLDAPSGQTVTVDFASADGSATSPADYTAVSGGLTFVPGDTSETITVPVNGDLLDEIDESFTVSLSNAQHATLADPDGLGTITDDDALPALSVNDITVAEGAGNATFTVTLSPVSGRSVTVDFATAHGTAGAADYTGANGTLTFAAGDTSETITVPVTPDALDEDDEGFVVNLTNASNATLADDQGAATITDDDELPQISISDVTVVEGNAGSVNANFTVSLNAPSGRGVSVAYATANGDATAPADYTAGSGPVSFAAGQTTQQVTVPVNGDVLDESDETFTVGLSGPLNATVTDGTGVGTISDDDALPQLTINDVTVTEGNSGTTNAVFTVTLSPVSGRTVTVNYATADNTAAAPADYTVTNGTLTFVAGDTTETITVPVTTDVFDETTEAYFLNLSGAGNATIADNQGVGTILDDDGEPTLAIDDVTVAEGDSGFNIATFTVSLSPASGQQVSVGFATENGTAIAPGDYATTGGNLVFTPGQTTRTLTVQVNGDALDEDNENFRVLLSGPVNATIADGEGIGTITDNDALPELRIGDATVTEGNAGTVTATFNVTLNVPSGRLVTADYATTDSVATAQADYVATSGPLSFAPGETSKNVTVTVNADLLDEANEVFFVDLSNNVNATPNDTRGVGTITDDDPLPTLNIGDATIVEGNAGTTMATFSVTLSPVSGREVTVQYATGGGTASTPADYETTAGTLNFAAGETTKTISVPVHGDGLDEENETFNVTLSTPGFATITDGIGVGTITDDDELPALSVDDVTIAEGDSGTSNATFTVSLAPVSGRQVTVQFATANDSATAPADYASTNGTLTFAAGETTKTVAVPVAGDLLDENDETFRLNLSTPGFATIADGTGVGTITDNDAEPALSVNDISLTEGNTGTANATFTVTLAPVSGRTVTVNYTTNDGTALAGADYAAGNGTLTFAAGETTKTVVVPVIGDLLDENDETFFLDLSVPANAGLADAQGVATINDNDPLPTVSIGDATVTEGNAGTVDATFSVTLNTPSGRPVAVDFATVDGSATSPADFAATGGTLTFAAGETTKTVTVAVNGDVLDEGDDTFTVVLSNPVDATVADGTGVGTITDDDALAALTINDVTVAEGNAGTVDAIFTVSLSPVSGRTVTVNFATSNGSATAPGDYTTTSGTLTFLAGETSKTITVPVSGDVLDEINETFNVTLSNAPFATITDDTGVGTITDDDGIPSVSVNDATVLEGNGSAVNAVFTVSLNAASGQTVTVDYATADGTATSPADFTAAPTTPLTFAPGQTSKTVTVSVAGDVLDEDDETYTLNLSNPSNATLGDAIGLGTITDNDVMPKLSINDVIVPEGDTGTVMATYTVSLDNLSGRAVTVQYATVNGNAVEPADYLAASGTLTFAAGETSKTIPVTVNADTLDEVNEIYSVHLSSPNNATIDDGIGQGTITDDDPLPVMTIGDATVTEGNAGTVEATFAVTMTPISGRTVAVNYTTAGSGSNPASAGADFAATSGTLTFAPGETTKTVTVLVNGDVLDEFDETFAVNLSNPGGTVSITDPQGVGTITDDDATPTLTINDVSVTEGDAGTVDANFTLSLSAASGRTVSANFATANQSATSGADYVARSGSVTFTPGQTSQQLTITVNADLLNEVNETYSLNLTGPTNVVIGDAQGIGTIIDDDPQPTLSINDVTVTEGNSGTVNAIFTVSLSAESGQTVSVGYATADNPDGFAVAGVDYNANGGNLVFSPGTTTRTLTIGIRSDVLDEFDETYFVNLTDPVNAAIVDGPGLGTITDNDPLPALSVGDVTVTEGNTGTVAATFTVSLNTASGRDVTVNYSTADGTATSPADYQAASGSLTFPAGQTSQTVTVQVNGDMLDEGNDTFVLDLSNPGHATIADAQAIGTITDDDPLPALTINDATVLEGDSGTTNAVFTVSLGAPSGRPVSVDFTTNTGAATTADFVAQSGTLTFAPGETTKTITVAVNGDLLDEDNETYTITLSNAPNATLTDNLGLGTITDDDATPTLSINDVAVAEGNAGTVAANFTVSLSAPSGRLVTAAWTTANDTAIAPGDYTAVTNGTVSFPAGDVTKTITVLVNGDLLDELVETFRVNLASPVNATFGDSQGIGTIADDDGQPTILVNDATVTETNTGTVSANFTVSLSNASGQEVRVDYLTENGTATAPADYVAHPQTTLIFAPGETTKQVSVLVNGDVLDEPDTESFTVRLLAPVNAAIADELGLGTITDNDPLPILSVNDVTVAEGDTGTVAATFTVSLNAASERLVTANWTTANGSATAPDDYTAVTDGTVSFAAGETSKQVTVLVNGDVLDEADADTFFVNLSNFVNAAAGDVQGLGTITDDDATPSLSINDVTVTEGNSGTTNAVFTVTLSAVSGRTVAVNYATANGSATAPADYLAAVGPLSFAPGETTKTISVTVNGDLLDEADNDTFFVNLSGASSATIADSQGQGTISDDDALPAVSVNDVTVTESNTGTVDAVFTVSLNAPSGRTVTVDYATAPNSAVSPADYNAASGTLTFAAGETSKPVTVQVKGDALDEFDETYFVNLTLPASPTATLGDGQGVGTIIDDDAQPTISINDVSVIEGASGTANAVFNVTLSAPSGRTVTVGHATADVTATAGTDYTGGGGNLVFDPGMTSRSVTVPVTSDLLDEPDETFHVNLSGPSFATIAKTPGVGTITDDDDPPTISINDVTVTEGNTGTVNATFTATLFRASGKTIHVDYATANDSAVAPGDYTALAPATLTFNPGQTTQTITVAVNGDLLDEANEQFFVDLSNPDTVTIADGHGVGTITDDDPTPTVSVGDATIVEGSSGTTNAVFTVSLGAASGRNVSVDYVTTPGSATAPADFTAHPLTTLTFAPGETAKTIAVAVNGDVLDEDNENFTVNLSGPTNATIADGIGLGTITDDDALPTMSINDVTVLEGHVGTVAATFTVSLDAPSGRLVTADFSTANGEATAPSDYTAASGPLSFAAGETTKQITVNVNGDLLDEIAETFAVNLTNVVNASAPDPQGIGTINDDDGEPTISITDATVTEGNGSSVDATFNVTLSNVSGQPVTVKYRTIDGSATSPADFAAHPLTTLTFAPLQTSKTVTVVVAGDSLDEIDESFVVELSEPTSATIADPQGLGTITDNDPLPTLSVNDVTVAETDTGTLAATFTVSLNTASGRLVSANWTTANASAAAPADFAAVTNGTVSFAAGELTKQVTVNVNGDLLDEDNENFFVDLATPTNAVVGDGRGQGTITDNDPLPAISINDITVTEGDTGTANATFTLSLSAPSGRNVSVGYATGDGSAIAPLDFTAATDTVTFAPGETSKQVTVLVNGDTTDEFDETFVVNLAAPVNATLATTFGTATITDDDAPPTVSVADISVNEGNSTPTTATFTATLSAASAKTVSVNWATADDTALAPADYTAASDTVTFLPGQTTKTFQVTIAGDVLDEADETFKVNLSLPVNTMIADSQAVGTILDNDATATLSVNDVAVTEGDSGTTTATFTVTLSAASGQEVKVNYATADQTATAPADYLAVAGQLTFAPGETTKTVPVTVNSDLLDEVNETYFLNLASPQNAALGDGQGLGTITDNDPTPTLSINDVTVTETDAGTVDATFTVSLSAVSGRDVTVNYATSNGTASAPADYTGIPSTLLTFAPGQTTRTITVTVNSDLLDEANETFNVTLTSPSGAALADGAGVGTIADNDPLPSVSVNDVTVTEGDTGTVNAVFTVSLDAPSGRNVLIDYATANDVALAPGDYASNSGTLTFTPGQTSQQVTVIVNGDLLDEANETYFLNLTDPATPTATIVDNRGVGTILDDDTPPSLSINDVAVTEGASGHSNAQFTVSLSAPSGRTVSVGYATADNPAGGALAGTDYVATGNILNFTPGQMTRTFTVQVTGDTLDEIDETYFVDLSSPVNATITDGQGVGTITDDDNPPSISIADVTVTEGNTGTTDANFNVTLSAASGKPITVVYSTSNGSAIAPGDYAALAPATLTFNPGQTSRTVAVAVNGDVLDEANTENFFVDLATPTNATIADAQAQGTITDDDPLPTVSIGDATVTEGNAGTVNATFTVSLNTPSGRALSVDFATAAGSATAPADFTAASGPLNFAAGETSKTVTVVVNGDALDEIDETFTVVLSNAVNVTIGDGSGLGTITDDDALPAIAIDDVTVAEGNAGTSAATFTVSLTPVSGRAVSVNWATANGTAVAPGDYAAASGTVNFAVGETTKTVTVLVNGDITDEVDETFTVELTTPTNATLTDGQGLGRITDDDGVPSVSIGDVNVTEGNGSTINAVFTATLSNASEQEVRVDYATFDGTALAGSDYTAGTGQLVFAPSQLTRTVSVPVAGDLVDEMDENFTVKLTNPSNANLGDDIGLGTILDNDPLPTMSVNDVTVAEGDAGTVAATFTVTMSPASGRAVSVDYATLNGSATQPADYGAVSGTLNFAIGETTKQVTVLVNGDTLDEANDTFTLNLSNASNVTLTDATGLGTINDDDPLPALSIGDATVTEGDTGTVAATFTVTMSPASGREVRVDYAAANGTATTAIPADFAGAGGTLIFAAGETTKTITVNVNGDALNEANETFFVNLTGPVAAQVADGQGLGTITNDDPEPTIAIDDVSVTEGDAPGTTTANFTVSLSSPSGQSVTVEYATAADTAASPADFTAKSDTVTFAPGQATRTIAIQVKGDAIDEVNETYVVNLSNATHASIADNQGTGTIIDDDGEPALSVSDVTVTETNAGTSTATFTVTLLPQSGQQISVGWATADGTATEPADYTAAGNSLVFAPGQTSKTVQVLIKGDTLDEDNETFTVNLSDAVNAAVLDGSGLGTITDNDSIPTLSINDVSLAEGHAGLSNAVFTVTLSVPSGRLVTVSYSTASGTAIAGEDFTEAIGSVAFAPGETTKPIEVPVHGDTAVEPNEAFFLNLSGSVNATVTDGAGQAVIMNDDATPPPPPPPPPPPDTTPPAEVTNLRVSAGDGFASLRWTNPTDPDFQGVTVRRIQAGKTAQNVSIYDGGGTSLTDRGLKNGSQVRYRIKTRDRSGNESAGIVVSALPKAALFAPLENAVITGPPLLQWISYPGARYYNMQLFRVGRGGQAQALTATKILSAWPTTTRFKLKRTWRYGGKRYTLSPGKYRWYVWPGLGKRAANKYGPMLGDSAFTVKAKKTVKKKRRR